MNFDFYVVKHNMSLKKIPRQTFAQPFVFAKAACKTCSDIEIQLNSYFIKNISTKSPA